MFTIRARISIGSVNLCKRPFVLFLVFLTKKTAPNSVATDLLPAQKSLRFHLPVFSYTRIAKFKPNQRSNAMLMPWPIVFL